MKKYLFLVLSLLFACSVEKKTIDELVNEINNKKLKEIVVKTECGDIVYKFEGEELLQIFCDSYMGDGGIQLNCYYQDDELIYCKCYSFYEGPQQLPDGSFTPGGERVGDTYKYYYENDKVVKCLKNDEDLSKINPKDENLKTFAMGYAKFAKKIKATMSNTDLKVLCDEWF